MKTFTIKKSPTIFAEHFPAFSKLVLLANHFLLSVVTIPIRDTMLHTEVGSQSKSGLSDNRLSWRVFQNTRSANIANVHLSNIETTNYRMWFTKTKVKFPFLYFFFHAKNTRVFSRIFRVCRFKSCFDINKNNNPPLAPVNYLLIN